MDDLNILIKAKLSSTATEIGSQIKALNKQITEVISVKLKIDAKDLAIINDTIENIRKPKNGGKINIFNENDLKEQGVKYKQGVMRTIEDVEKYLKGAFNGKKFNLGAIVADSSGNIKSFEAGIKSANNQLEKVKFNLAEISKLSRNGVASTNSGYVLSSSQLSRMAVKPEQIFDRQKLESEGRQFFLSSSNIVERVKREFKSLGDVDVKFLKNSQQDIIGFTANITKADGVVRQLTFDMAKIKSGSSTQGGYIFNSETMIDKNAGSNIQKALDKLQMYENKIAKLKSGFTSSSTGIKDVDNLASLTAQYDRIKTAIDQTRLSSTTLSNEQRRGMIQSIANLELEIAKYKDLQRVMNTSASGTSSLSPKDVSLYQDSMQNKINNLQVGKSAVFANPAIQSELTRLTENIARFGTVGSMSAREVNLQFSQLTTSVRRVTAEMTRLNGVTDSVGTTFAKDIFKLGIWSLAATIIYAPFRAMSDGVKYVYQMDTALTDLSKVVDFSSNQLNEMADSAVNLGKQLGQSSVEIMKGMAEFGRITKDQNEIIELTRVAGMASNVTTMSAADAAKNITSSMITFGIEAKDSMKILNSWNEIQNNFR